MTVTLTVRTLFYLILTVVFFYDCYCIFSSQCKCSPDVFATMTLNPIQLISCEKL